MSRTVCSLCKAPLVLKDDVLVCANTDCRVCDEKYLHEELDRTRKALDVAIDELTKIKVDAESVDIGFFMTAAIFALAKIDTVLEQKDK